MIHSLLRVDGGIELYPALLDVIDQEIENSADLKIFECLRVPSVQPEPGCEIGMASLGEEKDLAFEPPHVVYNSTDYCFHGLIIA